MAETALRRNAEIVHHALCGRNPRNCTRNPVVKME